MRRSHRAAALVVAASLVGGCALPHHKDLGDQSKRGVSVTGAASVLSHYNRALADIDANLDASALPEIETGSMLVLDQSADRIKQRLGLTTQRLELAPSAEFMVDRFDSYPLWFVAVSKAAGQDQQVAAVFTRASSTAPWRVAAAPRMAATTKIPDLALRDDGTAIRFDTSAESPVWSDGEASRLPKTPQQIADDYASVLTSPDSDAAKDFVKDSFISQMRDLRAAQPTTNVTFTQSWKAASVKYVLRLFDGGALMFVTLNRTDSYQVEAGHMLQFRGSEAGAYLTQPVHRSARLNYQHQVLMLVPAKGLPLVIGQYGGLVAATGS
ncbi:MAG: hypothetical protein ABJA81_06675 [Nocardioidaceae bacterium]